jgi:hypothetical protein
MSIQAAVAYERLIRASIERQTPDQKNAFEIGMIISSNNPKLSTETRARLYTWLADQISD